MPRIQNTTIRVITMICRHKSFMREARWSGAQETTFTKFTPKTSPRTEAHRHQRQRPLHARRGERASRQPLHWLLLPAPVPRPAVEVQRQQCGKAQVVSNFKGLERKPCQRGET